MQAAPGYGDADEAELPRAARTNEGVGKMATSEGPTGAASPADRARKAMIGGEAEKVQESAKVAARRRTELLEACVKGMDNVRRTRAVGAAEQVLSALIAGDPDDEHRHTTNALLAVSIAEGELYSTISREGGVIHGIHVLARSNAEAHLRMELAALEENVASDP